MSIIKFYNFQMIIMIINFFKKHCSDSLKIFIISRKKKKWKKMKRKIIMTYRILLGLYICMYIYVYTCIYILFYYKFIQIYINSS